ncbi:hypothetical protein ACLMJK_003201 [Lecanora helva]
MGFVNGESLQKEKHSLNFLIIGAGSRGNQYADALNHCVSDIPVRVCGIAEPIAWKRKAFIQRHLSHGEQYQAYDTWQQYAEYEKLRQRQALPRDEGITMDGIFICVLDEMHAEVITTLAPLGLNIMSEKPLATTLSDCLRIYKSLRAPGTVTPRAVFSIGHVLRYSPHNMLLRKLLLEERVIGDILSIEHTEPVGWWHFSHSYVRGNWRKESMAAPSLLTKSCHDIDLLLWLLCSPTGIQEQSHLPAQITSSGSLLYFKKARKPWLAAEATNCLSCPAEHECLYSARRIYDEDQLQRGNAGWPINIIDPEIEDLLKSQGSSKDGLASSRLLERLAEDYDVDTPRGIVEKRPWFGRCVYEAGNDVCDDQVVTITWEDDPLPSVKREPMDNSLGNRGAKVATFHMVAPTEKQCERRGRAYGTRGEIDYNSKTIRVYDFASKKEQTFHPHQPGGGHGGGDLGLTQHFVKAISAVQRQDMSVDEAQRFHIGCTIEDIIRSHAMVFAAEEARKEKKVVDWAEWWQKNVQDHLQ